MLCLVQKKKKNTLLATGRRAEVLPRIQSRYLLPGDRVAVAQSFIIAGLAPLADNLLLKMRETDHPVSIWN